MYNYLPRSDSHSIALCRFIVQDLVLRSEIIREKARTGRIAYGLNVRHTFPNGKTKTLDFAIGIPDPHRLPLALHGISEVDEFSRVLISCEQKTCMTEHGKSQPRLYDELSSSHEIVHQGDQQCVAAGVAIINIASSFVSPLRQRTGTPLSITPHNQPAVANSMVTHLRGLPIRNDVGQVGFDAFVQALVNCNNQNGATLHTALPAPQAGQPDHYDTFINRIDLAFAERFEAI